MLYRRDSSQYLFWFLKILKSYFNTISFFSYLFLKLLKDLHYNLSLLDTDLKEKVYLCYTEK
mgnify:CR=1 FL=1